jgi:glyoxylase-like metal-dependent hydrolase (beta-lactamase superfamily II)
MSTLSRRDFLVTSTSCAAHLAIAGALMPSARLRSWTTSSSGNTVAREPFGRLEKIADGVWALISNPLGGDRTTLSNGGLIAGRSAVLAIEGFNLPTGAEWLANQSRVLTGRWPTHVALTHYHADHANGIAGYLAGNERPELRATQRTRDLVVERNRPPDPARVTALGSALVIAPDQATTLDLGGRTVRIVPRRGHTESDVSIELDDPGIVFCGDLFWNAMFPNYVDAIPTQLAQSVRALRRSGDTLYVPGHGALGRAAEYDRYVAMLDEVERAARSAYGRGLSAGDGAASFTLPPSLGEWTLFSKAFFGRAFEAWYRELGAKPSGTDSSGRSF